MWSTVKAILALVAVALVVARGIGYFPESLGLKKKNKNESHSAQKHSSTNRVNSRYTARKHEVLLSMSNTEKKRKPGTGQSRLLVQFVSIETCPETPEQNGTFTLRMMRNGDVYVDSAFNVVIPAKKISTVRQVWRSCREDGTSCEHFLTWDAPMDGCSFLSTKNAVWSPAFANMKPPFLCPIAATRYTNPNVNVVNTELLSLMPFPRNRRYLDRMEMRNENGQVFWCVIADSIFRMYKPRT